MRKTRKALSLLTALAMSASAFAGLTLGASAAEGDVLCTQDFEEGTNWTASRNDAKLHSIVGTAEEAAEEFETQLGNVTPATVTAPAAAGTNSLYVATKQGENPSGTYTITPAVTESSTGVYEVNFDTMLVSGDYNGEATGHKQYEIGLGTADKTTNFMLSVTDSDLQLCDGPETLVDTGIDLTLAGTWFNFDVTIDTNAKQYSVGIAEYDGDTLGSVQSYNNLAFYSNNATALTYLNVISQRYDGDNKGAVYCAFDNFEITEAAEQTIEEVVYSVSAFDENGNELVELATGTIADGSIVSWIADYAIIVDGKYYVLDGEPSGAGKVTADDPIIKIPYVEETKAAGVSYTTDAPFTASGGMTVATEDDTMSFTPSSDAGTSKVRYAILDLSQYVSGYDTAIVNFDSEISESARFTLNLTDATSVSAYGDTGMFNMGTRDSKGFRIMGTESNGGDEWLHTSVKIDFNESKLYYIISNIDTGDIIASSSADITATELKSMILIAWLSNPMYMKDIDIIGAGKPAADAEYDFEDGVNPFEDGDHATTEIVEDETQGNVLKLTADSGTGASVTASSSLDLASATLGAETVTVEYDSYAGTDNANRVRFNVSDSTGTNVYTAGVVDSTGYYKINGTTNSKYNFAATAWTHTTLTFDLAAGTYSFVITSLDGSDSCSGSGTLTGSALDALTLTANNADSTSYIDNITITSRRPDAVDFEDGENPFVNENQTTMTIAEDETQGSNVLSLTAGNIGSNASAKASYDISALTAGKSYVVVSYDSYVSSGSRVTFGVDDVFSQGWGKESYYIVNGKTGSAYTFAADEWVTTDLVFDLNAGSYTYTISDASGNSATGTVAADAASLDTIYYTTTQSGDVGMIDNIRVTALGEYIDTEITYDAENTTVTVKASAANEAKAAALIAAEYTDGVLSDVNVYSLEYTDNTATVEGIELTENSKLFVWDSAAGMIPATEVYQLSSTAE